MTHWREWPYATRLYCYIWEPEIIFQAQINQATITYPLAEVDFNNVTLGAYTDVIPGMTVLFGTSPGLDDLGRQRIRDFPTSTKLYFGYSSIGTHDGEVKLSDDVYVTVWNDFRVWSKIPLIVKSGTIYKDYNIVVGDYNTKTPPVANGGPGVAKLVSPTTGKVTINFDAGDSFATVGGSVTYEWILPSSGATLVTGTLTSQQIGVEFNAGRYWIHLTVTDTNSKTHTCHIPVVAADSTMIFTDFEFKQTLTVEGQETSLVIHSLVPESVYPDGTLIMIWEDEFYNSVKGSLYGPTGREHMRFVGWHSAEQSEVQMQKTGIQRNEQITLVDVAGRLKELPSFPQVVIRKASPTDWTQMSNLNIDKYVHYILQWHSTALDVADFIWSGLGSIYPITRLGSDGGSLFDQANKRADAIIHKLACNQFGQLLVTANPNLQDSGDRTATVSQTLDDKDVHSVKFNRKRHPVIHWLRGASIVAHAKKVLAAFTIAPGFAPGQGLNTLDTNEQLVADQTELNIREGHRYAKQNNPIQSIDIELVHKGYGGIEPADQTWVQITHTKSSQRDIQFTNERFLPRKIQIDYVVNKTGVRKKVTMNLEPEIVGEPAVTQKFPNQILNIKAPKFPPRKRFHTRIWGKPKISLKWGLTDDTGGTMHALFTGRDTTIPLWKLWICTTDDFWTPEQQDGPTWEFTNTVEFGSGEEIMDAKIDPFSPLYLGTGSTINAIVTTDLGIYTVTDILGTPSKTLRSSYTNDYTSIHFSIFEPGWVIGMRCTGSGSDDYGIVRIQYSTDYGVTWAESVTTFEYKKTSGTPPLVQLAIDPQLSMYADGVVYLIAQTVDSNRYAVLKKSTDHGATWSDSSDFSIQTAQGQYEWSIIYIPYGRINSSDEYAFQLFQRSGQTAIFYKIKTDGTLKALSFPASNVPRLPFIESTTSPEVNKSRFVGLSILDRNRVVLLVEGGGIEGIAYSVDGGETFQVNDTLEVDYSDEVSSYGIEFQMSTHNPDLFAIFLGRVNNHMLYVSRDFGQSLEHKDGNLPDILPVGTGQVCCQLFGS